MLYIVYRQEEGEERRVERKGRREGSGGRGGEKGWKEGEERRVGRKGRREGLGGRLRGTVH